ncbi:MAG: helix-hairpin-helix domain-containing protein, partial [bacterium]
MNRRKQKRPAVLSLTQKIQGLNPEFARALAKLKIISPEDLRDADLDFIIAQIAGLEYNAALRWQQQAFLQTLFAGMTARSAGVLVNSGIVSITAMAQVDGAQLKKSLPESRLQAWKFIASNIPANLVPEQLETAREVEPLAPPQAVALCAQGIKTLHDLRSINPSSLNFNLLPVTGKRAVALWQYFAGLRSDYGIGPA